MTKGPGSYTVEEIGETEAFAALEGEWNELLASSHSDIPFLRHEWFRTWWEHFGGAANRVVLLVRRAGRLVLAAPLMEVRGGGAARPWRTLQSATNEHSYRYEILVRRGEEEALNSIWAHLARRSHRWDLMQLRDWPLTSPLHGTLIESARRAGLYVGVWPAYESPYVTLEGDWDGYWAGRKAKLRSNIRNRSKRAGSLTVEWATTSDGFGEALEAGLDLERKSWKGRTGGAIACDPALHSFYRKWALVAAQRGWLRLATLRVAGQPAAFEYDLEYGGTMYCMKIAYDPAMAALSTGQLLKHEVLRECFRRGLREYDFLGAWSDAKRDWTSSARPHGWVFIYNRTLSGRVGHILKFGVRANVKRWLVRS